jgi:small subunit ribosomal protein S23e
VTEALEFNWILHTVLSCATKDFILDTNDPYHSKPSGLRAGRKLVNHRRHERWSSKQYNKSHSVTAMKANPLGGSCMSKGIVLEKMYVINQKRRNLFTDTITEILTSKSSITLS